MQTLAQLVLISILLLAAVCPSTARAQEYPQVLIHLDEPQENATVPLDFRLSGWALDFNSTLGNGLDSIHVYLDGPAGFGTLIGHTTFSSRTDVAASYGRPDWAISGFTIDVRNIPEGFHTLYLYAFRATDKERPYRTLNIRVDPFLSPTPAPPPVVAASVCLPSTPPVVAPLPPTSVSSQCLRDPNWCLTPTSPVGGAAVCPPPVGAAAPPPLAQAPVSVTRTEGVQVTIESWSGGAFSAVVNARVCNRTSHSRATNIRIEFAFTNLGLPVSAEPYLLPASIEPEQCVSTTIGLAPPGVWDRVRVGRVTWHAVPV